jgi:hypothetical protein
VDTTASANVRKRLAREPAAEDRTAVRGGRTVVIASSLVARTL